jgi:proline racemase
LKRVINFVKGHMGGNEIIVLYGGQVPEESGIKMALPVLDPPGIRGHQAGLIYGSEGNADLKVKIVDVTSRGFISMCGGLTQVLGKALIETDISEYLDIELKRPVTRLTLKTDAGSIPLEITSHNGRVERVLTGMKPFVDECYSLGIEPIKVANVDAMRVGKFLVVDADELRRVHSIVKFEEMDETALQFLRRMQEDFDKHGYLDSKNADFALYDLNSENPSNDGRLIFPHGISAGHIEPACGTGTVAVGIAMLENKQMEGKDEVELSFESGGAPFTIGGPDLTKLKLGIENGKVVEAYFSHSPVQILATGKLWI